MRHAKAHGHLCGHGGSGTRFAALRHGLPHLVFDVIVQVANHAHAGAFVDGFFHLGRNRNVFQNEAADFQTVFIAHGRVDDGQQRITQFAVTLGNVQHRHVCLGQRFGKHADNARAHGVVELIQAEVLIGARHFFQEFGRIHDAEIVGAKSTHAHHAKILVAHHHRVGCTPFIARKQAGVEVVHIALER